MSIYSNPRADAPANAARVVQAYLDLLGDRPPLEVLAETPGWLAARIAGVPAEVLARPEAPGKWSAAAVLAHLADSEIVIGARSRWIVGDTDAVLQGYDQDLWAEAFHYREQDAAEALAEFSAVRGANLGHWRRLRPEQWQRTGRHVERGPMTAERNLRIAAGHDLVHRAQLDRILTTRR